MRTTGSYVLMFAMLMALAVPLSRFTSRVGGGSAFYVENFERHGINTSIFGES